MTKRERVARCLLVVAVHVAASALLSCSGPATPRARNFLLVSIDTLRARNLEVYGHERDTAPRLEAHARRGLVFRRAMSPSSWTVPAHMSMLTGLDPPTHGLVGYPDPGSLHPDVPTLAEWLSRNGFRTAAFTGGGFVSARHGFHRGFDVFQSPGRSFAATLPMARRWLGAVGEEPFFLFVHGFDVHKPYAPPEPYRHRFCGACESDYDVRSLQPDAPRPTPAQLAHAVSQYDGEIAYVDDLLSDFLEELEEAGLLAETLVVVTSDHGEEWFEHGRLDHGHALYEELVHVPLFLFGPGVPSGSVDEPVSLVNLFPTVCARLGIGTPSALPGRDLLAGVASGRDVGGDEALFAFTAFSEYPYRVAAVRQGRWKLHRWELADMQGVDLGRDGERPRYSFKFRDRREDFVELFDLLADPDEQHDLAPQRRGVVEALMARLATRMESGERLARPAQRAPEVGAGEREALRELGYLE